MRASGPPTPGDFTPDPDRLYEVGRDGRPYTLGSGPAVLSEALVLRLRRWWVGAVLLNAAATGMAAAAALLAPRGVAAWFGLLPVLTAPFLLVSPLLRRHALRRPRHRHRARPGRFPPPPHQLGGGG